MIPVESVNDNLPSAKGVLHDTFQERVTEETLKSSTAVARVLFLKKLIPNFLEASDYSKMVLELEADRHPLTGENNNVVSISPAPQKSPVAEVSSTTVTGANKKAA